MADNLIHTALGPITKNAETKAQIVYDCVYSHMRKNAGFIYSDESHNTFQDSLRLYTDKTCSRKHKLTSLPNKLTPDTEVYVKKPDDSCHATSIKHAFAHYISQ